MSDELRKERSRQTTDGKSDRRNLKGRRRLHDMGDHGADGRII
jgi:hypothetical protein